MKNVSISDAPIAEVSISPKLIDEDTPKVTALCKTSSNPPIDQFKWYIGSRLIEKETSNTLVLQGQLKVISYRGQAVIF